VETGIAIGVSLPRWAIPAGTITAGRSVSAFPMFYKGLTSEASLTNIFVINPPTIYYLATMEEVS